MNKQIEEKQRFTFPASLRIKKSSEFDRIFKSGKKFYSRSFILFISESKLPNPRLGITVSKKVDKRAVKRNKLKRQLREVFRLCQHSFKEPLDIVVIAKKTAASDDYKEIERQITGCLLYHGFLRKD